jgi:2-polyprenyl-6-hydroxyphenyl methylase/3-demethylubiquinone-9 3-methyltransferase
MTETKTGSGPDAADSVDPEEIAKFSAMAEEWWDPQGKFRPLHTLNPTRLAFVRDRIAGHFGRDPLADRPLAGLNLLDIGCGGGLLAEPLSRLGAKVTGIDASERNIKVASVPRTLPPRARASTRCSTWRWSSTLPTSPPFWRPPGPL